MLLYIFFVKNIFRIIAVSVSLFACSLIEKANETLIVEPVSWDGFQCDNSQKIKQLTIYDIAQAFYEKDTLLKQNIQFQKVFVGIVDTRGEVSVAGVKNPDGGRPEEISINETVKLSESEKEFLWALAYEPRYLYDRWSHLLAKDRETFLGKRDSIHSILKSQYNSVKVISDLRSLANQRRYLDKNKSTSPISMHNFGFAADFAVFQKGRIANNFSLYRPLNDLTAQHGITWGGNFIGFVDPGHIQLFKNGAEMLRKYPDLRFEFEPYRPFYLSWMNKMIGWGKEAKAGDTKELLVELNRLKKDNPCTCSGAAPYPMPLIANIQNQLKPSGYQQVTDLLLVGDLTTQTVSLVTSNGVIAYPLGVWK
jgi:peptidoglycan LD-endopeptidase CwlK